MLTYLVEKVAWLIMAAFFSQLIIGPNKDRILCFIESNFFKLYIAISKRAMLDTFCRRYYSRQVEYAKYQVIFVSILFMCFVVSVISIATFPPLINIDNDINKQVDYEKLKSNLYFTNSILLYSTVAVLIYSAFLSLRMKISVDLRNDYLTLAGNLKLLLSREEIVELSNREIAMTKDSMNDFLIHIEALSSRYGLTMSTMLAIYCKYVKSSK